MHAGEVATAAQYGLGAIWVVLADSDLAMVSQGMAAFYPGMDWSDYYVSGAPDLVGLGKSLGANAVLVDDVANLDSAVAAALSGSASAPQVIVVKVDPAAIPPYYVPATGPAAGGQAMSPGALASYLPLRVRRAPARRSSRAPARGHVRGRPR